MNSRNYIINESCTVAPSNMNEIFQLHNHDDYEIFLFFQGDAKYIVENKSYLLEPFDIIIVKKNDLHRVYHNRPVAFHRTVLFISPMFFQTNNCCDYETQLLHILSTGNKIPGNVVRSSGLYDAFLRYKKYSEDYQIIEYSPILNAIIVEILYLISKITKASTPDSNQNSPINPVIAYLNKNFTEEITLDMLEKNFFISKHYICREFKKATGLTVLEYVRKKRLAKAQELRTEGMSLLDAAVTSGFNSYSSFYRAYHKEFNCTPRLDSEIGPRYKELPL